MEMIDVYKMFWPYLSLIYIATGELNLSTYVFVNELWQIFYFRYNMSSLRLIKETSNS